MIYKHHLIGDVWCRMGIVVRCEVRLQRDSAEGHLRRDFAKGRGYAEGLMKRGI